MDPIARMYAERDERGRVEARQYNKPPARFRASELGDCKRRIWYRHSGYVPAPRTGFQDDWGVDGDVHHDIVRQQMLAHGIRIKGIVQNEDGTTEEDKFIAHDFVHDGRVMTVSTRQDGWIFHEDHGWMLMEIKSVGHWKYDYMNKAYISGGHDRLLEYLTEKYPGYIYQIQAGLAIARDRGGVPFETDEPYTLDMAYLVIKDRSNCHIGFHSDNHGVAGGVLVPFDQSIVDSLVAKVYRLKGMVLDGTKPIPEYPSGSRQCGYCPFKYLCHAAEKRRKAGQSPAVVYPDPAVSIGYNDDA